VDLVFEDRLREPTNLGREIVLGTQPIVLGTLLGLANKLEAVEQAQASLDAPPENLADNFEAIEELEDEWLEDEPDDGHTEPDAPKQLTAEQREESIRR
jgi:hypothetical protein